MFKRKGGGGQRPFEQCSKKLHFSYGTASLSRMLSVPPNSLLKEVNSDGLLVLACENAFAELLDHGRLSHSTIAHDNHLEKSSVPGFKGFLQIRI